MCTGWGRSLLDTYLDKTSLAVEGNIHHLRTPKNTQEKAIQRATLLPFRPYGVKNLKNLCKFAESVAKPRESTPKNLCKFVKSVAKKAARLYKTSCGPQRLLRGSTAAIARSVIAVMLKLGFTPGFAEIALPSQIIIFS